ncbi:MAG: peptidylprolyl isomerase [Clostridia bacterium]|nr:peptidylprolyl isomerase [Clostridia bacterium]
MTIQTQKPCTGDKIAIMKTNHGDIYIRLFEQEAPKTVKNFVTLSENGYYDGLIFHRVINDFMIQGGDPTGTGCGGKSIYGESFEDEFSEQLHNLRGALSMANAGPNTNGSQFFIVQAKEVSPSLIGQMKQLENRGFPRHITEAYEKLGGTPWLDFKHSVFGQVYDGMDVVDEIAGVNVDPSDKPYEDVIIKEIIIKTAE